MYRVRYILFTRYLLDRFMFGCFVLSIKFVLSFLFVGPKILFYKIICSIACYLLIGTEILF